MNDFAGSFNVLLITSGGTDRLIRNRQRCPTFLSTTAFASASSVVCSLLNTLNYTTVFAGLDSQATTTYFQYVFSQVTAKLLDCGVTFAATTAPFSDNSSVRKVLKDFDLKSRVFLFFGQPPGLRNFLMVASEMAMTNGDHVYLAVCQLSNAEFGHFTWQLHNKDDEKVKRAYRSVLLLSLLDETLYGSPSIRSLSQEWADIYRSMYNSTVLTTDLPIPGMTGTHAATEMGGIAVMEALARQESLPEGDNGRMLADLIRNRTYLNLQVGGTFKMGSFGIVLHAVQLGSFGGENGLLEVNKTTRPTENDFFISLMILIAGSHCRRS
ncbi:hypothetical protein BV898_02147 [Hypsibius exemplaris]|uniref:Receptor ligand binding region domain-containing protein n=1 Tax=Hypsibius exemplaris TaxID=2072580 RepID=A0A1W0X9W8_HYPEX|nr:hypothetical protein BV898_02147 [Hypsibius exemplaris]